MKTLFLCSNPRTEASMRFRVLQFLEPLARAGHEAIVSSFFDEHPRSWGQRVSLGFARRARDLAVALTVDRIFIHREAFPLSLNAYARALRADLPLIFDFDDAVHLPVGGWRGRLAQPQSTGSLIARADLVFAGNAYLAEYAAQHSRHVRIVPTVVDTNRFCPGRREHAGPPIVGWVGSPSTARYLDQLLPVLDRVGREHPFVLRLVGAGRDFHLQHVKVENRPWTLETEVSAFQDLDIGVYPLADDAWSRGKCGFKAIQYMACGVPFVVAPIGAVQEIVRDGVDGVWARTSSEWHQGLVALLTQPEQRSRLSAAGRGRAVQRYSVDSLAPAWLHALERPRDFGAGSGPLTGMS